MVIGFSTGSLALDNVRLGLQMVADHRTPGIELSALREEELAPLVALLESLDLSQFHYISFHAPSKLKRMSEIEAVSILSDVAARGWPIIVHPDVINDEKVWTQLGSQLCIENMDKRKPTGRTASELSTYFARLPEATLCFDIGHARQIDPTMCEADSILRRFGNRLQQIHISLVNTESTHQPLNFESELAFRRVSHLIPKNTPIILESPVSSDEIEAEIDRVASILGQPEDGVSANSQATL